MKIHKSVQIVCTIWKY